MCFEVQKSEKSLHNTLKKDLAVERANSKTFESIILNCLRLKPSKRPNVKQIVELVAKRAATFKTGVPNSEWLTSELFPFSSLNFFILILGALGTGKTTIFKKLKISLDKQAVQEYTAEGANNVRSVILHAAKSAVDMIQKGNLDVIPPSKEEFIRTLLDYYSGERVAFKSACEFFKDTKFKNFVIENIEKLDYFDSNIPLFDDVEKYAENSYKVTEEEFLRCYSRGSGFQEYANAVARIGCRTFWSWLIVSTEFFC